jgi:DNA-binding NarL/FixJ family response regulator
MLADDYAGILLALERLLKPSCDVVERITEGSTLIEAVARHRPDVVVIDLFMPGVDGPETYSRIRQVSPDTKIVVVTAADDESIRDMALRAGAAAFVPKPQVVHELLPVILSVSAKSVPAVG